VRSPARLLPPTMLTQLTGNYLHTVHEILHSAEVVNLCPHFYNKFDIETIVRNSVDTHL
jgi:hypothetical protein